MKRRNIERMLVGMALPAEVPPGVPLVEIIGNGRVLIENIVSVSSYSPGNIAVKVCQGVVCISGENLELQQMTKNQLIISGVIFGISLTDWR